ncbi:transposase [Streptomyces sp. NPDC002838]|uniref:transposase n=1 Tax=Streptomyces sp. NPDC002838 TaxID=3154436 RepID=UPI003322CA63
MQHALQRHPVRPPPLQLALVGAPAQPDDRERIRAAVELDDWARAEALPSEEEISRVRHLINRIRSGMDDLDTGEREQIHDAVTLVRRHRTVMLGMPRMRVTPLDARQEKQS